MTFRIVPFEAWHYDALELQPAQAGLRPLLEAGHGGELAERSVAFSAIEDRVLACAGVIPIWPGRDCAWALLSDCGPVNFLHIHRAVQRFLNRRRTRRIEMNVDFHHVAGRRWARMLGFQEEGLMKAFSPDGRDALLYARICDERG